MGSFLKDRDASEKAVELIVADIINSGQICYELVGKEEQKYGDIRMLVDGCEDIFVNIEVKFDMRAQKSGNLCFEMSNGTRATGIMDTLSDEVYYVVPGDDSFRVFKFFTDELQKYISIPENVIMKKGGDGWKFHLAIVAIDKIIEDNVPFEITSIGE